MDKRELEVRKRLKYDFEYYALNCLKVTPKDGHLTSFVLNKAQKYIHKKVEEQKNATGKIRAIILKGRQQGCSTYIEGRFYWKVTHKKGIRCFILTHDNEATANLFGMASRYHEHCLPQMRPEVDASNSKELIFGELDSGYKIGTAGNKAVGRSSTIQLLHGSEVAYWPNAAEHAKGILQAVPGSSNTEIFLESTANGVGNYFYDQWVMAEKGESDFLPIFIPWFWQDEYVKPIDGTFNLTEEENDLVNLFKLSLPQINFRRSKIAELSVGGMDGSVGFKQEYPCTAHEAFINSGEDILMDSNLVYSCMKCDQEGVGPTLLGVDPARFGDDRTSIIRRRGRKAYGLESYAKKDIMEIVGIVNKIIHTEEIDKVFVDVGGLGAGVFDRLKELGHVDKLISVNSGSSPLDADRYYNKRAEMWCLMKEWIMDSPVDIPDHPSLHSDLCSLRYTFDSKSRLVLEKKSDAKKRGIRSPDEADALALTFAFPVKQKYLSSKTNQDKANVVMSSFNRLKSVRKY